MLSAAIDNALDVSADTVEPLKSLAEVYQAHAWDAPVARG